MDTPTCHDRSRRRERAGSETSIREICKMRLHSGYHCVHVLLHHHRGEIAMIRTHRSCIDLGPGFATRRPSARRRHSAGKSAARPAARRMPEPWTLSETSWGARHSLSDPTPAGGSWMRIANQGTSGASMQVGTWLLDDPHEQLMSLINDI